jgi:hypothetical protein
MFSKIFFYRKTAEVDGVADEALFLAGGLVGARLAEDVAAVRDHQLNRCLGRLKIDGIPSLNFKKPL